MDTRKLRIVKPPLPAIGVSEGCNSQFKSDKRSEDGVEAEIRAAFDAHRCELMDVSQNAQRVERDFMEDKERSMLQSSALATLGSVVNFLFLHAVVHRESKTLGCGVLAKICPAVRYGFNRPQQGRHFVLPTKPLDSRSSCLDLQFLRWISSDHQDQSIRVTLGQAAGRFQPVHFRHYEIHHGEMRRVKMKGRQCMMPVKRFPDHNPFGTLLQYCLESDSCRGTIIDYKNTDQANSFQVP
jgi:hypothetical protein